MKLLDIFHTQLINKEMLRTVVVGEGRIKSEASYEVETGVDAITHTHTHTHTHLCSALVKVACVCVALVTLLSVQLSLNAV